MKQEGFSLVIVVFLIAMLSSLAIVATKMGGLRVASMYGAVKEKQAYYIADAAYQHALFKLKQDSSWRGDLNDQPFAGGTYSLNVSQTSSIDDLTITAVGSIGGTERTITRIIPPPAKPFIIKAFAGNGTRGWGGNDGPALSAELDRPKGLYKDPAGNVYVADTDNHEIRYVNIATKNIHSVAGIGDQRCNNCTVGSGLLDSPEGVFVTTSGTVYFADTGNEVIRKVNGDGSLLIVAGRFRDGGFSGDTGPATNARLDNPKDFVIDTAGNIYIADTDNCRIRKVNGATGVITTYGGTGVCAYNSDGQAASSTQFKKPRGLAFDAVGNLYVADTDNHRIRKIDKLTNIVTTIAGIGGVGAYGGDGGLAVDALLAKPQGVAINQYGTVYIADTDNNRIRKIDPSTGIITTYAGTGTPGGTGDDDDPLIAKLNKPKMVIAYDDVDGHIIIADTNNNRIREVTNAY